MPFSLHLTQASAHSITVTVMVIGTASTPTTAVNTSDPVSSWVTRAAVTQEKLGAAAYSQNNSLQLIISLSSQVATP